MGSIDPCNSLAEAGKMKLVYFSNEFPKDDLQDLYRHLHNHSTHKSYPILAQFLSEATSAVKEEIRQLPTELKQLIPPFTTILSWAENAKLRDGPLCGAIDGVLLIVVQLAIYIGYVEKHSESLNESLNKSLAGLGIGLLSATAVSLSSNPINLPVAGADAVRLAFRMGVHVQAVSENLETRDLGADPDTWAYVVHNVDPAVVQKNLDELQGQESLADTGKVFISAVSRTSVTISGPPSRLGQLLNKSDFFRGAKLIALPVFGGLCHAPHVYSSRDTESIVYGNSLTTLSRNICPDLPVYSTSKGLPYPAQNAAELFECVISELLTQAICWDSVVSGFTDLVKQSDAFAVSLWCFGNSIPLNDLRTALSSNTPNCKTSVDDLTRWVSKDTQTESSPSNTTHSKLAIVGMSCRLPGGATDTEKFWELLEQGLDVSRQIPADRFDVATHFDTTGKELNKSMTQYGCFIDEPGMFDAPFFNMSPREAQVVDPQMRLALVTAYEALERAGYTENRTAATQLERIGTWYGQAADDYREVNQGQEVSTYYIPGGCRAFGPGRINYFFKFAGPSYSVDTACSSGLAAVELGCQALWSGEVDTAVVGGLNVLTNPDGFAGLCNGHFLTKGHNACKTWDINADGYCRADGIGSVVIKRLEDAQADNDNILAVVRGAGTNHSATAVSITHPHAGHQSYLSRQVLRQGGVDPLDVSYVELHGTGTQAGDYEEMQGIMDVYAPLTKRRSKTQPLHIGAVKSNVGHSESAAGTTALIKVLLMLQKNAIPPHIGIKTEMNQRFGEDFDKRNLHIPFEMTPWVQSTPEKKRLAVVNNFGAAGGNTTMVLEEAPSRIYAEIDPRPVHIVAVSAKTKGSLTGNIERLMTYLEDHPDVNLANLSYTTTARRYQHSYRTAIATSNVGHLQKQLSATLSKVDSTRPVAKGDQPPVAFAFTGQGASHKSMSLELYRDVPTFREHIQHLDSLARGQGFESFVTALDGSHPKEHSHSPVVTQLALVCTEIALAKYWSSLGVKPDVVVGHSLGEYAAMHVAGVITANEAIFMVGRRAQMLEEKCKTGSHSMMAVRASLSQISENSNDKPYTIACANGPLDTVLSGTKKQMQNVAVSLEAAGYRCIELDVAFAFHSEQTDPILDDFEAIAKTGVIFQEPKLPYISPLLGKVIFDDKTLNANYVRQATRERVDFLSAMENAQQVSVINDETLFIEIGPHPVCTGFVRSTLPSVALTVPSFRRGDDNWKTMAESLAALHLAGVTVGWNEFHRPFECRLRLLDLPTYAWNNKNYWLQYQGDWCLTKGNNFYNARKEAEAANMVPKSLPRSEIQTSTAQRIVEEAFNGVVGSVTVQSDVMHPDFLAAAHGHSMNGCGVVTSSIHADIAYTLGGYLHRKLNPKSKVANMNIANLVVTKGLVAQSSNKTPQLIQITATTDDIRSNAIELTWKNVDSDGNASEPFATAMGIYGDASEWMSSWMPITHLVRSRIEDLERLAADGKANRFSRSMAYTLFASNLVDYADKYRGMQSVVMHELEAFADVQLSTKEGGVWTVPPFFIDSVAHLAGFIMNCSDAMDTRNNFCVTPGWNSMRFAKPLTAGAKYRSYVKMIPQAEDPTVYLGDVYIMQDDVVTGMVGGIQFRRYPRILLSRFFSPPDKANAGSSKATPAATERATPKPTPTPAPARAQTPTPLERQDVSVEAKTSLSRHDSAEPLPTNMPTAKPAATVKQSPPSSEQSATPSNGIVDQALDIIANEGALDKSDFADETGFADLGVDSLMSLVIAEKFRKELDVKVSGSLFLDYPKIGDLRTWLEEYHS